MHSNLIWSLQSVQVNLIVGGASVPARALGARASSILSTYSVNSFAIDTSVLHNMSKLPPGEVLAGPAPPGEEQGGREGAELEQQHRKPRAGESGSPTAGLSDAHRVEAGNMPASQPCAPRGVQGPRA